MSGEEIKFGYLGKTIKFNLSEEGNVTQEGKAKEALKKLLFDIANSDGNKEISKDEFEMIKNLKSIFGKIGETKGDDTSIWLDKADEEFVKGWEAAKKKGISVEIYIKSKLDSLTFSENLPALKLNNEPKLEIDPKIDIPTLKSFSPKSQQEPSQAEKNKAFNLSMKNLAQKYDKEKLSQEFTKKVEFQKGKYLSHIAKEALQAEGIQKPTAQEINNRIAQIALVNDIKDVNNVQKSEFPLQVGKGTTAPVQGDGNKDKQSGVKEGDNAGSQTSADGITIKPDPDTTGWTEKADATTPEGVDLNNGELKTYTKGEGENVETKYTYEKDGIKVEATTVDELKTKIETIKTALEALEKTAPEGETEEAKATRIQGYENAINNLLAIGTEQAVLKAQAKLAEKKADVSAEFYKEKTIAMLNSGNVALIEQMFTIPQDGTDSGTLQDLVNGNEKIQDAIGAKIVELREKYNKSTITLDEQKILAKLEGFKDVVGINIPHEDAKQAQAATDTTPAKEATSEVFAKDYKTDADGNSAYHAKFKLGENDLTFKAKDAETLDSFLAELKVANAVTEEAKKTQALQQVFNTFALNSTDTELVKSLAEKASKFKATVGDLTDLVNKSNLDVIYAIDSSHLVDVEQADGQPADPAKTNFEAAKKARIEAIMADPELAKLPENAKYLERIAGVDITEQQTAVTSTTDISEWGDPTVTKYVKTADGYAKAAEGATDTVDVKAYTKDGKTVYQVHVMINTYGETIEADSPEAVLKLKQEIEALNLQMPNDEPELTPEQKAENLEKLGKMFELNMEPDFVRTHVEWLKEEAIIAHDAPEAKALVQKLLLTRDADIVSALTHKTENGHKKPDNTLFEKDPVALKTLAAMFKEIRDLENQGVRLTPEQIALKDVLENSINLESSLQGDWKLSFDENGTLLTNEEYIYSETPDYSGSIHDPAYQRDKNKIDSELLNNLSSYTKDEVIMLINLETVDAESMSFIEFENLDEDMSAEDKKAVQDAYVEKAKKLFAEMGKVGDTEQLNPANARYLSSILYKISAFNEAGEDGVDPDKAVIAEILGNFFVTEGENATVKIKDFRRFTYEEMEGLADAVAGYGTDAQKIALADMITLDEMEDGQFVRQIEQYIELNVSTRPKFEKLADDMTTKEEILDFISKMKHPAAHIPFDKIMEKFGNEPEVVAELLKHIDNNNEMSVDTRKKLLNSLVVGGEVNIPDGVDAKRLYRLLPREVAATTGENATPAVTMDDNAKKVFEHLVEQMGCTEDDINVLYCMRREASVSEDLQNLVDNKIETLFNAAVTEQKTEVITRIYQIFENLVLDKKLWLKQAQWADGATTEIKTSSGAITEKTLTDLYNGNTMVELYSVMDKAERNNNWDTNKPTVQERLKALGELVKKSLPSDLDQNQLETAIQTVINNISSSAHQVTDNSGTNYASRIGNIDTAGQNITDLKIIDVADKDWANSHIYAINFKLFVDEVMKEYKNAE